MQETIRGQQARREVSKGEWQGITSEDDREQHHAEPVGHYVDFGFNSEIDRKSLESSEQGSDII